MSEYRKPQRAFLAVTLMTVVAVTMVFMVYAALLASYNGGNVTISSMGGEVQYSLTKDPGSWAYGTLSQSEGSEWYARVYLASPPTQTLTVTWTLQKQNGTDWTTNTPISVYSLTTPTISSSSSTTYIYAYSSGSNDITNNYNWGQQTTTSGVYRVKADINTV
jgi:hypothetical protein